MLKKLMVAFSLVLFSLPAHAQVEHYTLDKPHTQIVFTVNHLGFSHSMGKFTDYSGDFTFDRTQPENSKVAVTIKATSLDLSDEKWNEHMKGPDFFNVEKFPEITFKSTGIKKLSDTTADITGDLTMLGVTKPVTLHTTHNKSDKFPFGEKYVSGFSARGTLKRSDFGMTYGLPAVGDDVELTIEVEGVRDEAPSAERAP